MINRVRLESSSESDVTVRTELVGMVGVVQQTLGGQWEEEEPGLEVQTATNGYWGRLTIRKVTR